jgi:stage II sporulation protein D
VLLRGKARSRTITGADLRRLLGYSRLWSTWLESIALDERNLVVKGKGTGHGVGMCQWGARGFALEGKGFEEILAGYYPGARLLRMY